MRLDRRTRRSDQGAGVDALSLGLRDPALDHLRAERVESGHRPGVEADHRAAALALRRLAGLLDLVPGLAGLGRDGGARLRVDHRAQVLRQALVALPVHREQEERRTEARAVRAL